MRFVAKTCGGGAGLLHPVRSVSSGPATPEDAAPCSPEAIARAFGARLQRDFPRDWARLLGLAVQAAMEQEHGEGG